MTTRARASWKPAPSRTPARSVPMRSIWTTSTTGTNSISRNWG